MKVKPLQNRVVFERVYPKLDPTQIDPGNRDVPLECRVLAVGPDCLDVKAGMRVIIPRQEGMKVTGVDGLWCRESAVSAIVS